MANKQPKEWIPFYRLSVFVTIEDSDPDKPHLSHLFTTAPINDKGHACAVNLILCTHFPKADVTLYEYATRVGEVLSNRPAGG